MTNSIADGLMSAYALPRTDQSLHMVKQMVQRGDLESAPGYKARLKELTKELEGRRDAANNVLKGAKVKIVNHDQTPIANIEITSVGNTIMAITI